MFPCMEHRWFAAEESAYNSFIKALLTEDMDSTNNYMNRATRQAQLF